jgi:hypothetical protein
MRTPAPSGLSLATGHDPVDEHVNFARRAEFSSDPLEFVLHLICLPVGEHVGKQRNRSA